MTDKAAHINSSGFPLQIGLAHAIDSTTSQHGWRVLHEEHAWHHVASDESGFIDLVIENSPGTVVLNVECKRPQDATWQFLLPKPADKPRRHAKYWASYLSGSTVKYFDWLDLQLDPVTYESEFCVVAGQDAKSRPMLERIASAVVASTEALALEDVPIIRNKHKTIERLRVYINVVATTANLEVCKFDPADVDLEKGMLGKAEYENVPYIRFRKQLGSWPLPSAVSSNWGNWGEPAKAKEHTVMVVHSTEFLNFIEEFELPAARF